MTEGILTMSQKELGRLEGIQRVVSPAYCWKPVAPEASGRPTHAFHSPGQTSGAPLPRARRLRAGFTAPG